MEKEVFQRMITEFNETNTRVSNLRDFILNKEEFEKIDNLNRDLLIAQLKAMESYLSVLSIRIGLNTAKDIENTEENQDLKSE